MHNHVIHYTWSCLSIQVNSVPFPRRPITLTSDSFSLVPIIIDDTSDECHSQTRPYHVWVFHIFPYSYTSSYSNIDAFWTLPHPPVMIGVWELGIWVQKLVIQIANVCFLIVSSLVRFGDSLVSVLGTKMCQNMAKELRSVSVTAFRVTSLLLWTLVPKRNGSHEISHG